MRKLQMKRFLREELVEKLFVTFSSLLRLIHNCSKISLIYGGCFRCECTKKLKVILTLTLLIGLLSTLFGCGGGGGGTTPAIGGGTMSGTAVKGPVAGATVTAYGITNGGMGTQITTGTTDSMGNFSVSIGAYSGPVMLQLSGGTYVDEATGATVPLAPGDAMTAVIPSVTSGETVTNIMVSDILRTEPMDGAISGSGNTATTDMKNYGIAIAAMSQYAQTIGMTDPAALITAMMNDASDGIMNGRMGSIQIAMGGMGGGMMGGGTMMLSTAGTSGLATAISQFLNNASVNQSGLTTAGMQTLINALNASNGTL
jgi:hypothetical protein